MNKEIKKTPTIRILNIEIQSLSLDDLLKNMTSGIVFTPNVDHLIKLQHDKVFFNSYQKADWLICDSKILNMSARFLDMPFREVIPGSSLLPAFYEYHKNNKKVKIFLLGAAKGVAEKAKERINSKVGRIIVTDVLSPSFGFEKSEEECESIIKAINKSEANVLVVGVGAPKQENWIAKYKEDLPNINLFMALGATIDFEAGNLKRAPKIIQSLSLEWLFRLLKEPKRLWKRYLIDDLPFFWLIIKQKMKVYKNPF